MSSPQDSPERRSDRSPLVAAVLAFVGALGYVVGVFAFAIVSSIVLMLAVFGATLVTGQPELFEELLAGEGMLFFIAAESILFGVGTVIAAVLSFSFGWVPKRVVGFAVPSPRELLVGIATVVVLLALALLLSLVIELLGVPPSEHALFEEDAPWTYYAALAALSILVIGPVEELLFRGLIQNYMRPAFGAAGAVVATSVLFAAVHLPAYFADTLETALVSLVVIFALSLVLGAVYERYRNIVLVMGIHGVYNAVLFLSQIAF